MYRIYAHYEAYRVDEKGVKSLRRGVVHLETPDGQIYGANLKASVIQQVTRQYPELVHCPFLIWPGIMPFDHQDESEQEVA